MITELRVGIAITTNVRDTTSTLIRCNTVFSSLVAEQQNIIVELRARIAIARNVRDTTSTLMRCNTLFSAMISV